MEVGGVEVPETIEENGLKLQLNGAGIREKFFLDVYVAALYLPSPESQPAQILAANQTQVMELTITSSHITRERLIEAIIDGLKASAGEDFLQYRHRVEELRRVMGFKVRKGDVYRFAYIPDIGIRIYRNGELFHTLEDSPFKKVLFGIWLGDRPVSRDLKERLVAH